MACSETEVEQNQPTNQPTDEHFGDPELPQELQPPQDGIELLPGIEFAEIPGGFDDHIIIDEEASEVRVSPDVAADLHDLEPGHILFSESHDGFGVQVVSAEATDDGMTVEYRPFELINIVHGDWDMELPLDFSETDLELDESTGMIRQGLGGTGWSQGFSIGNDDSIFSASGSAGIYLDPHFYFDGRAHASAGFYTAFDEDFGAATCQNALIDSSSWGHSIEVCADQLEMSIGLRMTAEAQARLGKELSSSYSNETHLINESFPGIPLVGPLVLSPTLTVTATANASASASGELSASVLGEVYAPFGFRWHHGSGVSAITPWNDGHMTFDPSATAEAHLNLNAAVTLEAHLGFDISIRGLESYIGIGGIGAGADLTAQADYSPLESSPCLTSDVVLEAYLGGHITAWVDASRLPGFGLEEWDIVQDLGFRLDPWTLAEWDDAGQFCLSGQERLAGELTETFGRDCDDPEVNPTADSCIDGMFEHCFEPPPDSCEGYVDGDHNILLTWPSGERVEIQREDDGSFITDVAEIYDEDEELCGSATSAFRIGNYEEAEPDECTTEANFTLEQEEEPEDEDEYDEEELEEMYEDGELASEGDEAGYCYIWEVGRSTGSGDPYSVDVFCPDEEDDESYTFSDGVEANLGCDLGVVAGCVFDAVDEFPED